MMKVIGMKEDAFLSRILGVPAFVLDAGGLTTGVSALPAFIAGPSFISAKLPVSDLRSIWLLEEAGFRFTEVNLLLGIPTDKITTQISLPVRPAEPDDEEAVASIAATAFVQSRFSLDPLIPASKAEKLKEEWVRNFFRRERGDGLFVTESHGQVTGFLLALLSENRETATIDLIASSGGHRRAGVGKSLVAAFARHYAGTRSLRVGTQASNVASVRFYESLGFRLEASSAVLHRHGQARLAP